MWWFTRVQGARRDLLYDTKEYDVAAAPVDSGTARGTNRGLRQQSRNSGDPSSSQGTQVVPAAVQELKLSQQQFRKSGTR